MRIPLSAALLQNGVKSNKSGLLLLRNKDSEDNGVALFLAHEESMLILNSSCLVKEFYTVDVTDKLDY
jgi:hypothetical protein